MGALNGPDAKLAPTRFTGLVISTDLRRGKRIKHQTVQVTVLLL
jgi:hypothetical protein